MAGRLKGKVALVTAAGQGIGRAIAEAFVAEGAKVIATDVDVKKLKGLKRATLARLDARSTADVNALVREMSKKVGTIDVLVNAAGYVHHGTRARLRPTRNGTSPSTSTSARWTAPSRPACRAC